VLLLGIAVLLSLLIDSEDARDSGGIIGGFLTESILVPLFGRISATLIILTTALLAIMTVSQISLADLLDRSGKRLLQFRKSIVPNIGTALTELKQQKEKPKAENIKNERRDYVPPPIVLKAEPKEELIKRVVKKPIAPQEQFKLPVVGEGYRLPPLDLLDLPDPNQLIKVDTNSLHANSLILQKKLADFGVDGEVVAVRKGPTHRHAG
jgi:S-DNA-T family DNA segregation ATPase FtsK/SpoIIIE